MNHEYRPGKIYYAFKDLHTSFYAREFFAWEEEFDHGFFQLCHCGNLCKCVESRNRSEKYLLICFERNRGGCELKKKCT